jgi:hypothetical protein
VTTIVRPVSSLTSRAAAAAVQGHAGVVVETVAVVVDEASHADPVWCVRPGEVGHRRAGEQLPHEVDPLSVGVRRGEGVVVEESHHPCGRPQRIAQPNSVAGRAWAWRREMRPVAAPPDRARLVADDRHREAIAPHVADVDLAPYDVRRAHDEVVDRQAMGLVGVAAGEGFRDGEREPGVLSPRVVGRDVQQSPNPRPIGAAGPCAGSGGEGQCGRRDNGKAGHGARDSAPVWGSKHGVSWRLLAGS